MAGLRSSNRNIKGLSTVVEGAKGRTRTLEHHPLLAPLERARRLLIPKAKKSKGSNDAQGASDQARRDSGAKKSKGSNDPQGSPRRKQQSALYPPPAPPHQSEGAA